MNKNLVNKLVLYIVDSLQDLEAPISTIRIIKYLYLIDYEHFIRRKETLTSVEWIRYLYGPYFKEWKNIKSHLAIDLEEEEFIGREKTSVIYRVYEEQRIDKTVDWATKTCIDRILEKWALEDIEVILDYIYTDTEPMQFSLLNEPLDFSRIRTDFRRERKSDYLKLSDKSSKLISKSLKSEKRQISYGICDYDEVYFGGVATMNEEDELNDMILNNIKVLSNAKTFFSDIE